MSAVEAAAPLARELEAGSRAPAAVTARWHAHKQRMANGRRKVWVTVTPADKDLLLTMGVLLEWDLDNRASVGQAIERLLEVIRRDHGLS
jgi:hypothetical protein